MKACKQNIYIFIITFWSTGGLKIWECTQDLINFIRTEEICLEDRKVLDLGCGVGILGIYALLNGAYVYFQDYVSLAFYESINLTYFS